MEKRNDKMKKVLHYITMIFCIIVTVFFIYTLLLLRKIETFYRILAILMIINLSAIYLFSLIDGYKRKKKKKYIISLIISMIVSIAYLYAGIIIFTTYSKINTVNKNELSYKTYLLSFKELGDAKNIKGKKIGMVTADDEDIENYILPQEVINKYNLEKNNSITTFNDSISLMMALIEGKVDAIFIGSNYKMMFESIESFDRINEIKEILEYSKEYKKKDIKDDTLASTTNITEPFTILLLGIDSTEDGIKSSSSFNGDTIMLISFDPKTFRATLFSIPRDTYVPMACGGNVTKINHAAWGGTNCMVKTVEQLTGIDINYYFKINFQGLIALVDSLGGIYVDVPIEFCEQDELRQFGPEFEICLKKEYQKLNGKQALALSRHRKTLPLGDFQRGQNQQLVVESIIGSLKKIRDLESFYAVLDAVSDNTDTNMTTDEMLSFYNVGKALILSEDNVRINITKTFLTGYDLYIYEGGSYTYTFQYYKQSLNEIIKAMNITLRKEKKDVIKTIKFSLNNPYERPVAGYKYYSEERISTIPDFTESTLDNAKSWLNANGIDYSINYITSNVDKYVNNQIIYQSIHAGTLLSKAGKKITLNVVKKEEMRSVSTNIDSGESEENTQTNNSETPSENSSEATE